MALTEEQLQQFYRDGYVVVSSLVPQASVNSVLAAAAPVEGEGGGWGAQIFDHAHPEAQAGVHRLLVEPGIVDAARSIFGNEPDVFYGMLAVVQARGGRGLPWHQDNQYTQLLGGAINIFAALCDITPDKAILWVAPGSHRLGTQPSQEADHAPGHREAVAAPENGIPLPAMKTGDVCIFDRSTYHRSLKNETDQPRFAYAAQFQSANSRDAQTGRRVSPGIAARIGATDLAEMWRRDGLL